MKLKKQRSHFSNLRRFALSNNQKDDFYFTVRQQCEAIEDAMYTVLTENFPNELGTIDSFMRNVYDNKDYV